MIRRLTKEKAEECSTPEMIRGLDFWHIIDNSTPATRAKWTSAFSKFQTREAWLKKKTAV